MFTGLSAFPLTPMKREQIDENAFVRLVERLVAARVDSIAPLGSTGNYAYLDREERLRITELAVAHAGSIPVMAGIGALRTRDVLLYAEDAQKAGASGLLLAPVSYQPLSEDEVYRLFESLDRAVSVPLCIYDNPRTTRFSFTDALHARIAQLRHVRSIKIPAVSADPVAAAQRIQHLRAGIPSGVTIGVSGDASAATGLLAGCDTWYSVLGGLFPKTALAITRAAAEGRTQQAHELSNRLSGLWSLFESSGSSLRVVATAAELLGLVAEPTLPLPLRGLENTDREHLAALLEQLDLN